VRRLFWKVFFTYWIALFVFSTLALYAIGQYLEHIRARHEALTPLEDLRVHLKSAEHAAASGPAGLQNWARNVDDVELVPWLVLGADGRDVLKREVPPRVLDRLRRYQAAGGRSPGDIARGAGTTPPSLAFASHEFTLTDGSHYWLVPDYQNASLRRLLTRPRVVAIPIALAALVGAMVSFLFARHLAVPIERLRGATRAYAMGDFARRVGPSLGGRRDEIADLARALDEMAGRLDSLLTAQRSLLRDVSHELRSPLARVQATLGLARQRGQGTEEHLGRIEHEMERLNELVGSILSFSRLESGAQACRNEQLDLAEIVAIAADDAHLEGEQRSVLVRVLEGGQVPAPFRGDAALIHSALQNILSNAVRHTPNGGTVAVALKRVSLAGRDEYVVEIVDGGPGVPADMLEKIFEPFVRTNAATSGTGIGLGLAITQQAVAAHAGSVHAENCAAGGLKVCVRLPIEAGSASSSS
jgi:two-component system, OmpR family, sensor histidine kinase CpxA